MSAGNQAAAFERCMAVGGVAVFPSDTVYGLACDAQNRVAVERLYALKRRPLDKPSAVMFFDLELALAALPELGPRTRDAFVRLLPAPVSLLVPNPQRRFPLACGSEGAVLGVRVPELPALAGVRWPVLQSSANLAGQAEARRLDDVPEVLRRAADMVLDGGELPGTASTVLDLRDYETAGSWRVIRAGAVDADALATALEGQFHFHPDRYEAEIRQDIPVYDRFQDEVVAASGEEGSAVRILELGTGTGLTAARLLERHAEAELVGVDESGAMLQVARSRLSADRVELRVARLQDELPAGRFDLVASALCVHHLDPPEKRDLFARLRRSVVDGARFVLGDVVVPLSPEDRVTSLTPGFDKPSPLVDQLQWLRAAGFEPEVIWEHRDLVVILARAV